MDMAHLEELLQEPVEGKRLIITDGVFSMDGDLAPCLKWQIWQINTMLSWW